MNKTLVKNWLYLLFSDISNTILNFFIFMFLARKLSPDGFGEFSALRAYVSLFSIFAVNICANHVITREFAISTHSSKKLFKKILILRLWGYILISVILSLYFTYFVDKTKFVTFSLILLLGLSSWDLGESTLFGFFTTKYTTILNIIFSIIWLSIIYFLPTNLFNVKLTYFLFSCVYFFRGISYFLISYFKCNKKEQNKLNSCTTSKTLLTMSIPYLWMRVIGSMTSQMPVVFISAYSGSTQAGFYAVCNRLIVPITLTINTVLRAIFPYLTKLYAENKKQFNKNIIDGFCFVLTIGTIIAAMLVSTSKFWIPLILGNKYINAINVFDFLAWYGVALCFDLLLSTILSSTYKQKNLAFITTIDVIIFFPLIFFGSKNGSLGLAKAQLIGIIIILFLHIYIVKKILVINLNNPNFINSLLFFGSFMLVSLFQKVYTLQIILYLLILIIFYFIKNSPLKNSHTLIKNKLYKKVKN